MVKTISKMKSFSKAYLTSPNLYTDATQILSTNLFQGNFFLEQQAV